MADAFVPNPNNYKYVNHKDENKLNNNFANLDLEQIDMIAETLKAGVKNE